MVGQDEILNELKSYTLNTLPHSIMLIGESGSGKHMMANEISSFYNLPLIDITENLSYDVISDIQMNPLPKMYLIHISNITEREQNVILKFIEEPSMDSYIMLIADTKTGILNTILNRCITYYLKPYSKEVLKSFLSDGCSESVIEYCKTPGQVMSMRNNIGDMESLVTTIINKLKISRFDNALSIVKKFNYKDEYDKFDINTFFNMMIAKTYLSYVNDNNKDAFKLYNIVNRYNSMLMDSRINREILMESMITNMWRELRSGM